MVLCVSAYCGVCVCVFIPMTKGRNKVKTAVYAVVLYVFAVQATLISEVLLKLLVDVVGDWLPAEIMIYNDLLLLILFLFVS